MFDQTSVESGGSENTTAPAWMRLHGEMKSAMRRRCAWDAENARHLREAEALQLWTHFGYISILEYLEREHGIEPRTANDRLRVSQALADLPMLEAELEDGSFQYSHVKELTRVATPETEEEWIQAARGKTCGEVQAMVAGRRKGDGPEDDADPDLRTRDWRVPMTPQMEAVFRTRRAQVEAELGHRVDEQTIWRTILDRSGECREGPSTPAQISMCVHCNRGWQNGAGRPSELEPAELERLLCDAHHLGTVDGEPGRIQKTLSDKKRLRIIARDSHRCAVPGCRSAKNLDVHHIRHRAEGGTHDDANLITLCSGHHAMHHRRHLEITGSAPDEVVFSWTNRYVNAGPATTAERDPASATTAERDRAGAKEAQRAHVGTNEAQRAHVGTNETQRAHVGTKEAQRARMGTTLDDAARQSPARPRSIASPRFTAATLRAQARDALVGLGWKSGIAGAAVGEALAHVGVDATIDVVIREALRRCPKPTS